MAAILILYFCQLIHMKERLVFSPIAGEKNWMYIYLIYLLDLEMATQSSYGWRDQTQTLGQ